MQFSVLSSGSRANSTFVEADGRRFLIDCGLSCRQAELRLRGCGVEPDTIEGIFVTHEHSDHIRGVSTFSRKNRVPVYANRATARELRHCHAVRHFETGRPFCLGAVEINPFSIPHDAADPVGYSIYAEGLKFSQVTDLGRVTPLVRSALGLADALVVEFNHDPGMLWGCWYPWVLKQRISSSHGHCSNEDAAALIAEVRHEGLQFLVLGHISENSNTPAAAREALMRVVGESLRNESVWCASPHEASPLFELRASKITAAARQ